MAYERDNFKAEVQRLELENRCDHVAFHMPQSRVYSKCKTTNYGMKTETIEVSETYHYYATDY